jgi:hypothetical protein
MFDWLAKSNFVKFAQLLLSKRRKIFSLNNMDNKQIYQSCVSQFYFGDTRNSTTQTYLTVLENDAAFFACVEVTVCLALSA